jgi:U32 family peptidase
VDKKRLPLFAPLDLGTAPILFQLMAAGIRSFKIEGRLKPAETMAQIVAAYRLLIDAYPTISKEAVAEARKRLKLAIGRRQSTGFYLSAAPKDSMVGEGTTQSGRYLGKIQRTRGQSFEICTHEIVKVGDRLNVQKNIHRPPQGFRVKRLFTNNLPIKRSRAGQTITIETPFEVHKGWAVVKQIDADAQTTEGKGKNAKQWPRVKGRARAAFDTRIRFDWNGAVILETEASGQPISIEEWPSHETHTSAEDATRILEHAAKGFPARLTVTECLDFPDGVPMTEQELEALRDKTLATVKDLFEAVRKAVLEDLRTPLPREASRDASKRERPFVSLSTLREARAVSKQHRISPIIPISEAAHEKFPAAFEGTRISDYLILELPTFAFGAGKERDVIVSLVSRAVQAGVRRFMVSNLAHFNLLHPHRKRGLDIIAGDALHCLNSAAFESLRELGATTAVFAQEGDAKSLKGITQRVGAESLVVQVYGKIALFRSRQPHPSGVEEATCVVGSSEKLKIFRRGDLTYVMPKHDFSLRHCMAELRAMGLHHFLYDLSYGSATVKRTRTALTETKALDERTESAMNFERGLT